MYRAYHNGNLFFDTSADIDELTLASATIQFQLGGAGTFNFTAEESNICYEDFDTPKGYVDVYRNNDLIWSGRIITPTQDLYKQKSVVCEGMFAVFNDSVYRAPLEPFNGTLAELIGNLISSHNEQVESDKQINIRTITVTDDYIYREYENVEPTMKRLLDLVDSYGGYMSVSKVGGLLYFDWLSEIEDVVDQTIEVGSISSITKKSSIKDVITVLIPLGAEQELADGTKRRVTIESVNNGNDYLESAVGIETYGRINGVNVWDDVTTPSILKAKGQQYLSEKAQTLLSLSITAVDLADLAEEESNEHFKTGKRVRVNVPHLEIDDYFTITTQNLNLISPASNSITVGATGFGYVGRMANKEAETQAKLQKVIAEYANTEVVNGILERVQNNSTMIEQNSEEISLTATEISSIDGLINQLQTVISQNSEAIEALIISNNKIAVAIKVDENGVTIGKQDDPVYSRQTNSAYQFVDSTGNVVLLEINTIGITAPTINASEQVAFLSGGVQQWAIRKGEDDVHGNYNLNDVWIGG